MPVNFRRGGLEKWRVSPEFQKQFTDIDTTQQSNHLKRAKGYKPKSRQEWNKLFEEGGICKTCCNKHDQQEHCRTCMSYYRSSPALPNRHGDTRNFREKAKKRKRPEGRAQWNKFFENNQGCSTWSHGKRKSETESEKLQRERDCGQCKMQWRISPACREMHKNPSIDCPSAGHMDAKRTGWR